jgi:hypothetical protein
MTAPLTPTSAPLRRALRQAIVRSVVAACLLVAGVATVRGLESMLHATFDKPRADLRKSFFEIPTELGLPPRFVRTGADEVLDAETVESLGTNEYLVRRYRDHTLPVGTPGSLMNLNVNYYGIGTSTPHVPEVCWAGSGREESPNSRVTFVVKGVKRLDGSVIDLPMRMISFVPEHGQSYAPSGEPVYSNVAYVFHVNGEYVSNTQEVTSRFWKASYRYAYHSKIEVTPLDPSEGKPAVLTGTQAQAQKMIGDFIREALPEIEACLPDPSDLTAGATPTGADHLKQR